MDIEIGSLVTAKVSHIADFGAFVVLEDGKEGMVHISEVANEFVKNIHDFVQQGQTLTVKVLGLNKQGKYELSLKRAAGESVTQERVVVVPTKSKNDEFEDKMSSYLKRSEEKQIDIRRNLKKKQGITKRKK